MCWSSDTNDLESIHLHINMGTGHSNVRENIYRNYRESLNVRRSSPVPLYTKMPVVEGKLRKKKNPSHMDYFRVNNSKKGETSIGIQER